MSQEEQGNEGEYYAYMLIANMRVEQSALAEERKEILPKLLEVFAEASNDGEKGSPLNINPDDPALDPQMRDIVQEALDLGVLEKDENGFVQTRDLKTRFTEELNERKYSVIYDEQTFEKTVDSMLEGFIERGEVKDIDRSIPGFVTLSVRDHKTSEKEQPVDKLCELTDFHGFVTYEATDQSKLSEHLFFYHTKYLNADIGGNNTEYRCDS